MSISDKIKRINNKIEQNNVQYSLYRKNTKISALSSRNIIKYEFLTSKDVLPEKDLLEKTSASKRLEYLPLGKELKAQINIAKNKTKQKKKTASKIRRY